MHEEKTFIEFDDDDDDDDDALMIDENGRNSS
jgi:hypothetical protein